MMVAGAVSGAFVRGAGGPPGPDESGLPLAVWARVPHLALQLPHGTTVREGEEDEGKRGEEKEKRQRRDWSTAGSEWMTRGTDGWTRPLLCVSVMVVGDVQEIPLLQLMGALYMGNKVTFKGDSRVNVVMEQVRRDRSRHTI